MEVDLILWLPKYMALRKVSVRVLKEVEKVWSYINSPFLPEDVPFEGEMFMKVPLLKMED